MVVGPFPHRNGILATFRFGINRDVGFDDPHVLNKEPNQLSVSIMPFEHLIRRNRYS